MDCHFIDELKEFISYDQASGIFTWLKDCGRAVAGSEAGCVRKNGYRSVQFRKQRILCQRLAWMFVHGKLPDLVIDHIDGNPLNNRISNLRDVPESVNFHNRSGVNTNNTTGLPGVTPARRSGFFLAQVMIDRKHIHLGTFPSREEAHAAYLKAKAPLCGF